MRRWDTSARQTFPVKHTSRIFKYLELIGYIEGLCGRFAGSSKHDSLAIALGLKGAYCDLDWHRDWG